MPSTGGLVLPPYDFDDIVWSTVIKATDESVASNTVDQNDDDLSFLTVSGGQYEIEIILVYGSPAGGATPDLKVDLGEDATARGDFLFCGYSNTDTTNLLSLLANQTATAIFGTATTDRICKFWGTYTGGGGIFRVRWAQNTSGVNPTIVRANSLLRYRQVV